MVDSEGCTYPLALIDVLSDIEQRRLTFTLFRRMKSQVKITWFLIQVEDFKTSFAKEIILLAGDDLQLTYQLNYEIEATFFRVLNLAKGSGLYVHDIKDESR